METFVAGTVVALGEVAGTILTDLKEKAGTSASVLTLAGVLGAGKTEFVKQLGQHLGVTETIVSPTFVVMKRYETTDATFKQLIHIDAYRLADEGETTPLHFTDLLKEPQTLICIEWSELIPNVLPAARASLLITDTDGVRTLTYTAYGQ